MPITDAQIHLWKGDVAPPHHWRAPYTLERALREMDEAGIARAINCPATWDAGAMDYATQAATLHPERFATLGWFPLDESANVCVLEHCLTQTGMLGLRFVFASPDLVGQLVTGQLDWLWECANQRELPVGLFVLPQYLPLVGEIAARFPRMRLLIDHLAINPLVKLPDAAVDLDALLALARHPNIAVKATGVHSMAIDAYPFNSTHTVLKRSFDAFGAERMFWGTDISRLHCSWRECVTLFTEELPWLKGSELERVMGGAVADWIGWR